MSGVIAKTDDFHARLCGRADGSHLKTLSERRSTAR
jgi:hypothetical protein